MQINTTQRKFEQQLLTCRRELKRERERDKEHNSGRNKLLSLLLDQNPMGGTLLRSYNGSHDGRLLSTAAVAGRWLHTMILQVKIATIRYSIPKCSLT